MPLTLNTDLTFEVEFCCNCGVPFAMTADKHPNYQP